MFVLSDLTFKGGAGKTTMTENLSDAMRRRGKKVGVLDGDRQRNCSTTLLRGQVQGLTLLDVFLGKATIREAMIEAKPGLFVVPSSSDLDEASEYLVKHPEAYSVVKRQLVQVESSFDVVVIDHAGAYTPVMKALLLASHAILIPALLEPYPVGGLFDIFATLKKKLPEHQLVNAGIIPYGLDLRYGMSSQYLVELREEFGDLVGAPIRTDSLIKNAQSLQMTIFEYEEEYKVKSRAARDFYDLADDLIEEFNI